MKSILIGRRGVPCFPGGFTAPPQADEPEGPEGTFLDYVRGADFCSPTEKALAIATADLVESLGGDIAAQGVTSRRATDAFKQAVLDLVVAEKDRVRDQVRNAIL